MTFTGLVSIGGLIFLENLDKLKDSSYSDKLDYISVCENSVTHKQIEFKSGIVFMRMKKRRITT